MITLVSAILPARGRTKMSELALECWRKQTWSKKELVILDDEEDPGFATPPKGKGIVYARVPGRMSIGAKRNECVKRASGKLIVHFDSDDVSAPGRIADQVKRLRESKKAVTSYSGLRFTDGVGWWKNMNWPGGYGSTLMYRRDWWEAHPFPAIGTGEDWHFVETAMHAKQYVKADAAEWMYATIHLDNTSPRVIGEGWLPMAAPK